MLQCPSDRGVALRSVKASGREDETERLARARARNEGSLFKRSAPAQRAFNHVRRFDVKVALPTNYRLGGCVGKVDG